MSRRGGMDAFGVVMGSFGSKPDRFRVSIDADGYWITVEMDNGVRILLTLPAARELHHALGGIIAAEVDKVRAALCSQTSGSG